MNFTIPGAEKASFLTEKDVLEVYAGDLAFRYRLEKSKGIALVFIAIKNLSKEAKKLGSFKIAEISEIEGPMYLNNWQSWLPYKRFDTPPNLSGFAEFAQTNEISLLTASPVPELLINGIVPSDYFISGDDFLIGALASRISHPYFIWDKNTETIKVYVELFGKPLEPGNEIELEPFAIFKGKYNENVERYALKLSEYNDVNFKPFEGIGWCSWYNYFTEIDFDELSKNISLLKVLKEKEKIPYTLIQLDDGYQKDIGDWTATNDKFPSLEKIAGTIKENGFTAGIWLAPFSVSETSSTFRKHPDWLVKDSTGKPKIVYKNWNKNIYGLDLTHPEALAFLAETFKKIESAGFKYFKIDFLFAGLIPGIRHDTNATPVEAYRKGMETIKTAVGEEAFILGCGAPLLPSIGFVDGMRVGADTDPEWKEHLPDLGFPSAKYAIRNPLTRYFMNMSLWHNDPDTMILRHTAKLSENERELYATVCGLLDNMLLQSDDMAQVDEKGIALLKKASQLLGGRPRVYQTGEESFVIAVKGGSHYNSIGIVNLGDSVANIKIPDDALNWSGVKLEKVNIEVGSRSIALFKSPSRAVEMRKDTKYKDDGRQVNYYEES
ncbi:glycoside hydrolase [Kosmotoga arenicorallina S304]|uniref:Glycoside hydrolase n=1 Tax=Kosmotoga arenicorallina S304 TaxID=1453497 RepID=A0A176JZ05_9BACT|nr:glycoside hydrolase family 36 protein [Kosmotoga arenicorallina]OAA29188.1 glycoside hydrolase [Kosmotoga arenicorallina S304]